MKLEIRIGSDVHQVEWDSGASPSHFRIDGRPVDADAVVISPVTYSILIGGRSLEVRVSLAPDGSLKIQTGNTELGATVIAPSTQRGLHGAIEAEGRQPIVAPMPGKVVRLLVKPGDTVEAGQGILVVEAMKMQNEIRSPKGGAIERVLVAEGQAVNAGEVLAWVE